MEKRAKWHGIQVTLSVIRSKEMTLSDVNYYFVMSARKQLKEKKILG